MTVKEQARSLHFHSFRFRHGRSVTLEPLMAAKTTVAIIGAGLIGPRHAQSVIECADAELIAFVDPNSQTDATARSFGVPCYRTIECLLALGRAPDAAIVCTPNHTHVDISEKVLHAGLHVLVEKPVSVDVSSGARLSEAVRATGKQLLVGHHRRFHPYVVATKKALESDAIGRPIALSGLWTLRKPDSYFAPPADWRSRAKGGGPVLINLIHDIDILQYLLGPITRVHAERSLSQRDHQVEEGAAIMLRFASGVVGTFVLSDATPSPHSFESGTGENPIIPSHGKDFYRIFGSKGTVSVGDMKLWKHAPGDEASWSNRLIETNVEVGSEVPFDEQIKHFVRVVQGLEAPRCSIADGLRAVMVTEAVKEALDTGLPVDIARASTW